MAERKPLSKKIRFEVFKRDSFTCQYCGRTVPDVILHVDHIKPVSKGGTNDIMNLVTSCQDCNLGKGARELSDNAVVKKQQKRIKELAEKNEQLEMFLEWRNELQEIEEKEVRAVNDFISSISDWSANEQGKRIIKRWIKEFSLQLVMECVGIAFDQYYCGDSASWNRAFDKVGGICRNKSKGQDRREYYKNYMVKVCRNRFGYYSENWIRDFAYNSIDSDEDFEDIKQILKVAKHWTDFKERLRRHIGNI